MSSENLAKLHKAPDTIIDCEVMAAAEIAIRFGYKAEALKLLESRRAEVESGQLVSLSLVGCKALLSRIRQERTSRALRGD